MAIILRLDRVMADRKMSLKELSERAEISNVNLSNLKTGKVKAIRFSTLEAICGILDCQPGDILEYEKDINRQNETERKKNMYIRAAEQSDLEEIMSIYAYARIFMAENGNPNQWRDTFPARADIEEDIRKRESYVCVEKDKIMGVFAFIIGEDPTYRIIEEGKWMNEELYGAIHRVASAKGGKGIFANAIGFCKERIGNLRIDTHHDNKIMQHVIEKNGFQRCGIIYAYDGSPRIAYQWVKPADV